MDFGKKYRVGNFEIIKLSRSLTKNEIKQLRTEAGIPVSVQKYLTRGSLPYIKVRTISGMWALEWSVGMTMFNIFDSADFENVNERDIANGLLRRFYGITSVLGDAQMERDIQKVFADFLGRIKANKDNKEEEKAILDNIEAKMKAEKNISEIGKEVRDEKKE